MDLIKIAELRAKWRLPVSKPLSSSGAMPSLKKNEVDDALAQRLSEDLDYVIDNSVYDLRGYRGEGKINENYKQWISEIAGRLDRSDEDKLFFIHSSADKQMVLFYEIARYMKEIRQAKKDGAISKAEMEEVLTSRINHLMGYDTEAGKENAIWGEIKKAKRAVYDLETIAENGHQPSLTNEWHGFNWDIRPLEKSSQDHHLLAWEASAAAANIAENIALLVNAKPELAASQSIIKALDHTVTLAHVSTSLEWTYKELEASIATGLKVAASESGVILKDSSGNTVNVDDYLKNRFEIINYAIESKIEARAKKKMGPHTQRLSETPSTGKARE